MPEMKRNFTAGKMNKDFDERIIPQGEYVDAMNVQISTSEGSNVGTIQSVLGNGQPESHVQNGKISEGSTCIGSIADEKNSYIYWFTAQDTFQSAYGFDEEGIQINTNPEIYIVEGLNYQGDQWEIFHSDFLTKQRREGIYRLYTGSGEPENEDGLLFEPVFVDNAGTTVTIFSGNVDVDGNPVLGTAQRDLAINEGYASVPAPVFPFLSHGIGYNNANPTFEIYDGENIRVGDKLELWGLYKGKPINFAAHSDHAIYVKSKELIGTWFDYDNNRKSHYQLTLTCSNPNLAHIYTLIYNPYIDPSHSILTSALQENMAVYWQENDDAFHLPLNLTHINFVSEVLELNPHKQITGINILDDMLFWTDGFSEPKKINISRSIKGTDESGLIHTKLVNEVAEISPYDSSFDSTYQVSNTASGSYSKIKLNGPIDDIQVGQRVTCLDDTLTNAPCVDLAHGHITVIDIDPDGDDPNEVLISEETSGPTPTLDLKFNWDIPIHKKHVTVIKPSPKSSLDLELETGRDTTKSYSSVITISDSGTPGNSTFDNLYTNDFVRNDFGGLNTEGWDTPGNWYNAQFVVNLSEDEHGNDTFDLAEAGWDNGKEVVIREFNSDGTKPGTPIDAGEYVIRGVIAISGYSHKFNATTGNPANVRIVVKEISGIPSSTASGTINFLVDLYTPTEDVLFEFKFPRFSYRYKYEDGEYSTFAPWTRVAFIPGNFDYHPKKGYNLGMVNRLKQLTVSNFIPHDMPRDVSEVDILYKDDRAPEIYVVDTVRPNDEVDSSDVDSINNWNKGSLEISSDSIHSILPSNQLFRHYDNVPKTALAQEVIGNRIVYGNYTQGYDLTYQTEEIAPRFKYSIETASIGNSIRSIKSLRDYKLGVIFVDKYGRETPVISNKSAEFKIDKQAAKNKNRLKVGFNGQKVPNNMEYFKFYIKETASEYYNLAMDRWYDAGDDNVWLSFPSSDRNKIDIDTYLILKKGAEGNDLVVEKARYKILAIENEAPDFIKTETQRIGRLTENGDLFPTDSYPSKSGNSFTCKRSRLNGSSLANIHEMREDLHVEFYNPLNGRTSQKYEITSVGLDVVDPASTGDYNFTIKGFFDEEDLCNNTDVYDGTCTSPTGFKEVINVRFYKSKVINSAKFDGRFFVKIFADGVFDSNIANSTELSEIIDYRTLVSKKVYYLTNWRDENEGTTDRQSRNGYKIFNDDDYWETACHPSNALDTFSTTGSWHVYNEMIVQNEQTPALYHSFYTANGDHLENHYQKWRAYFKHNVPAIYKVTSNMIGDDSVGGNPNDSAYTDLWDSTWGHILMWSPNPTGDQDRAGSDLFHCISQDRLMRNFEHDTTEALDGFEDVLFIDNGTHVDHHTRGNPVRWTDYGDSLPYTHTTSYLNEGIRNWSTSNGGRMDLGLGPIFPSSKDVGSYKLYDWVKNDYEFWKPQDRAEWSGTNAQKLLSGIEPAQKFRWAEDPSGTVYIVNQQVSYRNKIRFSSESRDKDPHLHRTWENPYTYTSENYTDNTYAYFEPRMDWDPTMQGVEGPITNGRIIRRSWNGGPSTTDLLGYFTDNRIIISEAMFEGTYDIGNHQFSGNEFKTSISPGLALTRVQNGTCAESTVKDSDDYLFYPAIVKSIEKSGTDYILELTGYNTVKPSLNDGTDYVSTDLCFGPGLTDGIFTDTTATYALRFEQLSMNGLSVNSAKNINNYYPGADNFYGIQAVGYTLELIAPVEVEALLPENPAIWETEPKDDEGLDIYYEISENLPINLTSDTINSAIPIKSNVIPQNDKGVVLIDPETSPYLPTTGLEVEAYLGSNGDIIKTNNWICVDTSGCVDGNGAITPGLLPGDIIKIKKASGVEFGVGVVELLNVTTLNNAAAGGYDGDFSKEIRLDPFLYTSNYTLDWHNCYSFGNGVESNRIRDSFNLPYITNGVKASTVLANKYTNESRESGMIYSGIYNSISGTNNLNQFIVAEKITKDINPIYGSIQKLHARDTDLVLLCENKILKILASKDALYNADGKPQLVANENVLGQTIPFVGEYGISKNPESFVAEAYRAYFTDRTRGVVLRLSKDGLTPISEHGMKGWFRDNLKLNKNIVGSYDDKQSEYNVTLPTTLVYNSTLPYLTYDGPKTVSFKEDVKGWVSFKSFIQESGVSCSNNYHTFKGGKIWQHGIVNYGSKFNNFYNNPQNSHVTLILNAEPGIVKSFNTLNYEGSPSRIKRLLDDNNNVYNDGEYYNAIASDTKGWYVESISTNKQDGSIREFIEKEGKWFNYIKGKAILTSDHGTIITSQSAGGSGFDQASFAMQGLGQATAISSAQLSGCTDPNAVNYDPDATMDDGSCIAMIDGCTDPNADNYYAAANNDDGSCVYLGCMDETAGNWDPNANVSDGSCWWWVYGCTDPNAFNHVPGANAEDPDNPCYPFIYGCMAYSADNYIPLITDVQQDVNTEDGTCIWARCTIEDASNYVAPPYQAVAYMTAGLPANTSYGIQEDWSCLGGGCMDDGDVINNPNYITGSGGASSNQDWWQGTNVPNWQNLGPSYQVIWNVANYPNVQANNYDATATFDDYYYSLAANGSYGGCTYNTGCTTWYALNQDFSATIDDGSCIIPGCIDDPFALNYGCSYLIDLSNSNIPPVAPYATCNLNPPPNDQEPGYCVTQINGCMDTLACNYNQEANIDNGTCDYSSCAGCIEPSATNYLENMGDPASFSSDCYVTTSYMSGGNVVTTSTSSICTIPCGDGTTSTPYSNPSCCTYSFMPGCTDPTACNYDSNANADDGSCSYACWGCMDDSFIDFCPTCTRDCAGTLGGSDNSCCVNAVIVGCMDENSCIFNSAANTPPSTGEAFYNANIDMSDSSAALKQGCFYGYENIRVGDNTNNSYPLTTSSNPSQMIAPYWYEQVPSITHADSTLQHNWNLAGVGWVERDVALRLDYKGDSDTITTQYTHVTDYISLTLEKRDTSTGTPMWSTEYTDNFNNPMAQATNSPTDLTNGCEYHWGWTQWWNNYNFQVYEPQSTPSVPVFQRYRITLVDALSTVGWSSDELAILTLYGACETSIEFEFPYGTCSLDPNSYSGCTDSAYCNYDPLACDDDGSCNYTSNQCPGQQYSGMGVTCNSQTGCEQLTDSCGPCGEFYGQNAMADCSASGCVGAGS